MLVEDPPSKEELRRRALELLDLDQLEGMELCDAFVKASKMVRYSEPQVMVAFAEYAADLAGELDPQKYGELEIADCRCRTLAELGNAYRVADQHKKADKTLGEAMALWYEGTADEALKAHVHDYQASLYAARRDFETATQALDTVQAIYEELGDAHLAGRALISKGIYRAYEGDQEEAIRLLKKGLAQIDPKLDPNLHYAAIQSQASFLVMLGRFREAQKVLWSQSFPAEVVEAPINRLKLLWLESVIYAGLGQEQRGEEGLREVIRGFHEEKLHYKSALAGLDLVKLWYQQGRLQEVRDTVTGIVKIFRQYDIHREALAALSLLESALARGIEAGAILDRVADFIRRAETQSGIKFEDFFRS